MKIIGFALFAFTSTLLIGCCTPSCLPRNPYTPRDVYYNDYYQTPQAGFQIEE